MDRLTRDDYAAGRSLTDVVERMRVEFGSRLPMPLVVTTVHRCRRELDIIDGPALPELLERLARQRLRRIIEASSASDVQGDGRGRRRRSVRRRNEPGCSANRRADE